MATYDTSARVQSLYTLYEALIDDMTYAASASHLAIYQGQARVALSNWGNAAIKYGNIVAAANTQYSTGVGTSFTKAAMDDARDAVASTLSVFACQLLLGGVTLPSTGEEGMGLWDMSGFVGTP